MSDVGFLEALKDRVLVCDGAMGTVLYSRGVPSTRCYEELNLLDPELVKRVHRDYIAAGAEMIETNTFGANPLKLRRYAIEDKVYEINKRGAEIAKEVAGKIFVAGSVGPLVRPLDIEPLSKGEMRECFEDQIEGLVAGGVDCILIETMSEIDEAVEALRIAKGTGIPVICQMSYGTDGRTISGITPRTATERLSAEGADVIGANCGVGPGYMLGIVEEISSVGEFLLSVQPNAGFAKFINGRFVYPATPEYFAEYAKRFVALGANIVGGCCGTTPEHIRAVAEAVRGSRPGKRVVKKSYPRSEVDVEDFYEPKKKPSSVFSVSAEVSPPRDADLSGTYEFCRRLKKAGLGYVNVTDSPMGRPRMDSVISAYLIKREAGLEPVFHYTCRDKNLLALQAELLGADALGLRNVLALTGDPPNVSDLPFATGVFHITSKGLVKLISNLNKGLNFAGRSIGKPTRFSIGVGANFSLGEREAKNLEEKVALGVDFIQTQPVFDVDSFKEFVSSVSHLDKPIIAGIMPLQSYRQVEYLHNEVPGIEIPEETRKRVRLAGNEGEEGCAIALETLLEIRDVVNGVCIMSSKPDTAIELLVRMKDVK